MILRRRQRWPQLVEVRFGNDLTGEQVEAVLTVIGAISRRAVVVFETLATEDGIRHFLRADPATIDTLRLQLGGLVPTATLATASEMTPGIGWQLGARVGWGGSYPLLRADGTAEAAAGLLAAIGQLGAGEQILVRVAVRPARPRPIPQPPQRQQQPDLLARILFGAPPDAHEIGQIRAKYSGHVLQTSVLLAIASPSQGRAAHLLSRTVGALRTRRGTRGAFTVRALRDGALRRAASGGARLRFEVSPGELAPLTGWPIGAPPLPGLSLGTAPLRQPDKRIPARGRMVARSTWPGARGRLLAQPAEGALSHTLVAGPTGVGKSALVGNLCLADIKGGRGVLVVDGKNDLAGEILSRIPAQRLNDVIVVDPAANRPTPGLRVFGKSTDPELAADVLVGVLREIFAAHWGIRSDQWIRAAAVTIAHDPHSSLGDLPFLFSDDTYRRRLVGRLRDPHLLATWAAYEAMSPGEKTNQIAAPLGKLNELLGRRVLRTILSQPEPTLDLDEVLATNKIVIASLSPGQLGAPAARLLGALLIHGLFSAVQARTKLPAGKRTPFFVYVDEPRVLGDLPVPLDSIFELARGLGVGLTISVQSPSQLPGDSRQAALTNAGTLICFTQAADDADLFARHLSGISAEQLQHLGQYEIVARIGLGPGQTAAPATGKTLPLPPASIDADAVRAHSASRYGRDPNQVDQALAERHGHAAEPSTSPDGAKGERPIGRSRRKP